MTTFSANDFAKVFGSFDTNKNKTVKEENNENIEKLFRQSNCLFAVPVMFIGDSGLLDLSLFILSKSEHPLKYVFEISLAPTGLEYVSAVTQNFRENKCPHIKNSSKNGKLIISICKMLTFIGYDVYGFYCSKDNLEKQIKNKLIEDFKNEVFDVTNLPDIFWVMEKSSFENLFK